MKQASPNRLNLITSSSNHRSFGLWPAGVLAAAMLIPCSTSVAHDEDGDGFTFGERLSATVGVDIVSEYFFRGYLQEDNGFIAQPYAELGIDIVPQDETHEVGVSATLGIWNSLHEEKTAATGSGQRSWYESDWYGSVDFTWKQWSAGIGYTFYTYPSNDQFDSVQELGLTVGLDLDNEEGLGFFLGDPSFGFYFETDESNVGQDDAKYFQFDFGPSFDVFDEKATLSFPMSLGLSLDEYYVDGSGDDETFGFFSATAQLDIPLHSGEYGSVDLSIGATLLLLGDTTEATNDGDDVDGLGFIGMSISF